MVEARFKQSPALGCGWGCGCGIAGGGVIVATITDVEVKGMLIVMLATEEVLAMELDGVFMEIDWAAIVDTLVLINGLGVGPAEVALDVVEVEVVDDVNVNGNPLLTASVSTEAVVGLGRLLTITCLFGKPGEGSSSTG